MQNIFVVPAMQHAALQKTLSFEKAVCNPAAENSPTNTTLQPQPPPPPPHLTPSLLTYMYTSTTCCFMKMGLSLRNEKKPGVSLSLQLLVRSLLGVK